MSTKTTSNETIESLREQLFWLLLFVGMTLVSLGIAFLVLAVAIGTTPPSPYLKSATDRMVLFAISIAGILAGAATVRYSGKVVGW